MLSQKFLIVAGLIVLIFIGLGVWLGANIGSYANQSKQGEPSEYSAVYLSTGDIYYGMLSWFPRPRLKNVWFLQKEVDQNNQAQLSIAPFRSAFWGPTDEIYLNSKQIIFWTRIRNDSQVLKAIQNQDLLQSSQSQATSLSTSTFRGPSAPPPR